MIVRLQAGIREYSASEDWHRILRFEDAQLINSFNFDLISYQCRNLKPLQKGYPLGGDDNFFSG